MVSQLRGLGRDLLAHGAYGRSEAAVEVCFAAACPPLSSAAAGEGHAAVRLLRR